MNAKLLRRGVFVCLPAIVATALSGTVYARSPVPGAQQPLPVAGEACDAPWRGGAIYQAGNVVSHEGRNYTAAYWTQGNAPATNHGAANSGQPWRAGAPCKTVARASATDPNANFSPTTLQFLIEKTRLDGEQWNNIMKLVNKPEQDSLEWPEFYGYCENIGDDRGYTIGIFGATTGGSNDTGPDGPALFREFDRASGAVNPTIEGGLARANVQGTMSGGILNIPDGTKFCNGVKALQANSVWREAMWRTFYDVYIEYSVQQALLRGFSSALVVGSFVDTALNQGATGGRYSLQGLLARSGSSADEKTFMTVFYGERTKVVDTHEFNQPPNGKHRVQQWSTLLNQGETDLKDADAAVIKVTNWELQ